MALNIKNSQVERLAAEAAELACESKTEAIRRALEDRIGRLKLHPGGAAKEQRIQALLLRFREEFPNGDFGHNMTKRERETILGYGSAGV